MTIGERMRQKREERGITQVAIAEQMRERGASAWSQPKVWKVEAGQQNLMFHEAAVLANILAIDLDWLAYGEPSAPVDEYQHGYRDGLDAARKAIDGIKP